MIRGEKLQHDREVNQIFIENEVKAAIVKRAIKTIKGKMFKIMYDKQTNKFIGYLSDVVESYNNSFHSSVQTEPVNVSLIKEERDLVENVCERLQKGCPLEIFYVYILVSCW